MSLIELLFGRPLASSEEGEQRVGVLAGIPMLGLDALASAAYGPEAALTLLIPLGALGLAYIGPISLLIILLLLIVFFSYRQTISAYPGGGGSYTVARENLGVLPALMAAAALMLDYVLVVAVGISAGVGALVSAFPVLQPHMLALCLGILAAIALVNLRGVRESGLAFVVPTYMFIASLFAVILVGLARTMLAGGRPEPVVSPPPLAPASAHVHHWILMTAFASGCTAMTGVEAVSNGVTAFQKPAVVLAKRTLTAIVLILALLLAGIALLARAYGIGATEPGRPGYESILSQLVAAVVGRGAFYYITIGSVLAVLALSANTGFADFPRLCRIVALDNFLPHAFATRGRRLVFSYGIYVLTALAAVLLIAFGGVTDRLIPLFAVGAFMAFTLSQAGMVVHWKRAGRRGRSALARSASDGGRAPGSPASPGARTSMWINGLGAAATGVTLVVVLIAKFAEGAWVTVLLIAALVELFRRVRGHYAHVAREIRGCGPLDLSGLRPPLMIVPVKAWDTLTQKGLRFGLKLSPDVRGVHVATSEEAAADLRREWETDVVIPAREAGLQLPSLIVLPSPYRHLLTPLLDYISQLRAEDPDRQIAVIIPELVESRWYQYLMHNQRATMLKAALLFRGDQRVVVINVPWYLSG
jgi:amino acid transporter